MNVQAAARTLLAALPTPVAGKPVLTCIDGPSASGKSTLAAAVARAAEQVVTLVHGDDFYGPEQRDWRSWTAEEGYLRYFDHRRLERELLQPLRRGETARYQRYDWAANHLDGFVEVPPAGVVLVEGVYLLREYLRGYWDFSVYVDTARHLRLRRAYARGENDPGWIERWTAAEDHYQVVEQPVDAADLVIDGT